MEEQQFGCFKGSKCPKERAPNLDRLGASIFYPSLDVKKLSPEATLYTKVLYHLLDTNTKIQWDRFGFDQKNYTRLS